jgi:hypothetical protein
MDYNIQSTRIFFENDEGGIAVCCPSGELPVEVVAVRDLPNGTPYWIVDFNTIEQLQAAFPDQDFFDAYELDKEVLGEPHGYSLGYDEWAKLQSPGTLGV